MAVLTSRQFIAALVGLAFAFFGDRAGLSQETVSQALEIVTVYILGRGLQQGLKK